MRRNRFHGEFLELGLQFRRTKIYVLGVLLIFSGLALSTRSSDACSLLWQEGRGQEVAGQAEIGDASDVHILKAGFRAVTLAEQGGSLDRTHLWIELGKIPSSARFVILESVWGAGPDSMATMWGHALPIRNQHVFAYPDTTHRYRDQPFTLGLRIRLVYEDGSTSGPSYPVFINHTGNSKSQEGVRADQVATALCVLLLSLLWVGYRRAQTSVGKIRMSALLSLTSLLFLAASPAMPWMSVKDEMNRYDSVDCRLGNEVQCATYAPDSGPNPLWTAKSEFNDFGQRRAEIVRWVRASSALRSSLILCLILLLPALIWILVAPGLRVTHGAALLGASAAGYCLLASAYYRFTVPSWVSATQYSTLDLTLISTATIVVSSGLIVFWSCFGRSLAHKRRIAHAIAKEV